MATKRDYKPATTKLPELTVTVKQYQYILDIGLDGQFGIDTPEVVRNLIQIGIDQVIEREVIGRRHGAVYSVEEAPEK